MNSFFKTIFWGNTVLDYLIALAGIVLAFFVVKLIRNVAVQKLKQLTARTHTIADDLLIGALEKFLVPFVYILANYAIITQLKLSEKLQNVLHVALVVVITFYSIRLINFLIHAGVQLYMQQKNEPPERVKQLNGILLVLKVLVWLAGFIILIDNLGYDMTTLIAGLGVGGIAIALAAQNILGDLFSYLVIFFDKPFTLGDLVKVEAITGTVEKIGLRSTRIRTDQKTIVTVPNKKMVDTILDNLTLRTQRKAEIRLELQVHTNSKQIEELIAKADMLLQQQEEIESYTVVLNDIGAKSIILHIDYFTQTIEFARFQEIKQTINLHLLRFMESLSIELAGNQQ